MSDKGQRIALTCGTQDIDRFVLIKLAVNFYTKVFYDF